MAAYNSALTLFAQNKLRWADPAISVRCMLVSTSYVFNQVHASVADVSAYEVLDESYARRDVVGRTITAPAGREVQLRATPVLFPNLNVQFGGVILYLRGGHDDSTPGDDMLLLHRSVAPVNPGGSSVQLEFTLSALTLSANG